MGLTAANLKFIINKKKEYKFSGPILTFGNQDIYATENDVIKWLKAEKVKFKKPAQILSSTSGDIPNINKEASDYIHAKTFFEFLGISQINYYDIDKFNFDKPKILHDLQRPISPHFHNFFNFIIDSGTMEHIFDVRAVMENIAKMTKIGGYVLQFIPAQNFLNHGFYQFSPTFFYDFYSNNGFEIVESYLVEIRGNSDRFYSYNQKNDYTGLFFKPGKRLVNCFIVQKKSNIKRLTMPDQYFYKKMAENSKMVTKDFNRTGLDKLISYARTLIPIKYHGMFFDLWIFLKRITTKRKYFDIKK